MTAIIFIGGMLVIFWLLILMPQRRRKQQQASLHDALKPGDEVMTMGGIFGEVREVADNHVVLEIAPNTKVRLAKSAVTARSENEPEVTNEA